MSVEITDPIGFIGFESKSKWC